MSDEQNSNFTGGFKQFFEKPQSGEISGPWFVPLKSYQDKYLPASPAGDAKGGAKWDQDHAGENEWFKIEPKGGYKIALKSREGMYLSATADIGGTVRYDEREAVESAIWTVWEAGIALKSNLGKYLHPKKTGEVTAAHDAVTKKETFKVAWTKKEEK
jgi:hypothetical protein